MIDLHSAEDRYRNDNEFRMLVDLIGSMYERLEYTPSEVRAAAQLAMLRVEMRTVRPLTVRGDAL